MRDAARAIAFYEKGFGAKERERLPWSGERIGHAEIEIARAPLMLADEFPEMGIVGPQALGGSPVIIHLYVDDVDALVARAARGRRC